MKVTALKIQTVGQCIETLCSVNAKNVDPLGGSEPIFLTSSYVGSKTFFALRANSNINFFVIYCLPRGGVERIVLVFKKGGRGWGSKKAKNGMTYFMGGP